MDTNYYESFILIAEDCPAEYGIVPPERGGSKTKAGIEHELITRHPYHFTSDELLVEVHIQQKGLSDEEREREGQALEEAFRSKQQPCLRASMLPKKFGWGIHFDAAGKVALYPVESPEYQAFAQGEQEGIKLIRAMRNKRKES